MTFFPLRTGVMTLEQCRHQLGGLRNQSMAYVTLQLEQPCKRPASERSLKVDLHEEAAGGITEAFMRKFQCAKVKYSDMCMSRWCSHA